MSQDKISSAVHGRFRTKDGWDAYIPHRTPAPLHQMSGVNPIVLAADTEGSVGNPRLLYERRRRDEFLAIKTGSAQKEYEVDCSHLSLLNHFGLRCKEQRRLSELRYRYLFPDPE